MISYFGINSTLFVQFSNNLIREQYFYGTVICVPLGIIMFIHILYYTMSATLKFSNDQNNGTFSNQVSFLIYDSLCQQCDSNNACTIKVKSYLIYKLIFYF